MERQRKRFSASTILALLLALNTYTSTTVDALSIHRPTISTRTSVGIESAVSPCALTQRRDGISSGSRVSLNRNTLSRSHPIINSGRIRPSHITTCMSSPSTMPHADLAVRLDRPVLSGTQYRSATNYMWKSVLSVLLSDVFKTACVAFLIAFFITFAGKSSRQITKSLKPIGNSVKHFSRLMKGKVSRVFERFNKETEGVPMAFEGDGEDGWGVCTLASAKKLARSQYTEYEFKLPKADNVLQLALGQQLTLCCLDSADNVAKRNYYVYSPKKSKGQFSIIASEYVPEDDVEMKKRRARGEGDFDQVLATELEIGDEIALQPGPRTLDYKGEYLPVTDMVYFAEGDGIVPVIDQAKSVLPPGSSSVKGVSVIWANKDEKDFDIALSILEDEYFKYSTKLAVSCIVEDEGISLMENSEVEEALTAFSPGTMAVVSGPPEFAAEALAILLNKGFPEKCICVLPSE